MSRPKRRPPGYHANRATLVSAGGLVFSIVWAWWRWPTLGPGWRVFEVAAVVGFAGLLAWSLWLRRTLP